MNDTGVEDVVNKILENERRKMNIIIHNSPEFISKDREKRVDHDKTEILQNPSMLTLILLRL